MNRLTMYNRGYRITVLQIQREIELAILGSTSCVLIPRMAPVEVDIGGIYTRGRLRRPDALMSAC